MALRLAESDIVVCQSHIAGAEALINLHAEVNWGKNEALINLLLTWRDMI